MVLKRSKKDFKSKSVKVRGYYTVVIFLLLIFLDRITKMWATSLNSEKDYGIIAFTYTTNNGAGFSILQNMNVMLVIISIIVLIAITYFYRYLPKFSLIMITSGVIGNLVDRISYGAVIDFINLKFWPIFNVADSLIFVGVVYWIIVLIRTEKKSAEKIQKKSNPNIKRMKK